MKSTIVRVLFAVGAILLAGCATHAWAPGPNAKGTFDEASAQCSLMARHSGSGEFYAQGSPGFVAGATVGAAVGDAIRTQADFNDCMKASGWVVADADPDSVAKAEAMKARVAAIHELFESCQGAVRNNPKYAALLPHLKDVSVGHYTLTQMSDSHVPTPQEATLLAEYGDKTDVCTESAAAQISSIDPRIGQAFQKLNSRVRNLDLALINRQMSWGEYARDAQAMIDSASGRPDLAAASSLPTLPPQAPMDSPPLQSPQMATQSSASSTGSQRPCSQAEATQKRVAIENGYTMIPNCQ